MTNRRDFFRSVAMFGMAMVDPRLAVQGFGTYSTPSPQLRIPLASIINRYSELTFGVDHPSLIVVSPQNFQWIVGSTHPNRRFSSDRFWGDGRPLSIRFNDADLIADPTIPRHLIRFINEKFPHVQKLNGWLDLKK